MLSSDQLAPITNSCGLIKAPHEEVVDAFVKWVTPILQPSGCSLGTRRVSGRLSDVVRSLLPLTTPVSTKHLFIATKTGWTVMLDNGRRGTDCGPVSIFAGRCQCETLRVTAQRDTMPRKVMPTSRGTYGGVIMEVFNPDGTSRRTLFAANDGGRWKFGQSGLPFEFEDLKTYQEIAVRDRFTIEMLSQYLRNFGAYPFENEWYVTTSEHPALLVSRLGRLPEGYREYSLEEGKA